jgi:hypothetical protein
LDYSLLFHPELVARLKALREAGVSKVQLGELVVELALAEPQVPVDLRAEENQDHADPLRDPATFPGGRIPRFFRVNNE